MEFYEEFEIIGGIIPNMIVLLTFSVVNICLEKSRFAANQVNYSGSSSRF